MTEDIAINRNNVFLCCVNSQLMYCCLWNLSWIANGWNNQFSSHGEINLVYEQSWYCSWWSGCKLEFCVHLEPGCVAFIAQWIKTIQEGMVLTPDQVKWIIIVCTQIMPNAVLGYPLESPTTQPTGWAVYFDAVRAQGPAKVVCDSWLCRNCGMYDSCDGYIVLSTLKISYTIHRSCLLG